MRNAAMGLVGVLAIVLAVSGTEQWLSRLDAQTPAPVDARPSAGELIALSSETAQGRQQITVIDPRARVMSVYHVEHSTGTISLKGVRNIQADLLMDEFNTDSPLPREIRALLKQR
jgi:hypothetical protein